jgi:hypothetical protein
MTLVEAMLAKEPPKYHEALKGFAAGWDAMVHRYGGLLQSHGVRDFRPGFEDAWNAFKSGSTKMYEIEVETLK